MTNYFEDKENPGAVATDYGASGKSRSELTRREMDRQDAVDNAVQRLIEELIPEGFHELLLLPPPTDDDDNGGSLEWDIEPISRIRDLILADYARRLRLEPSSPEFDRLEMAFYPYLDISDEEAEAEVETESTGGGDES